MRYFISPYKPNAVEGKEPSIKDSRYTKFFETAGQIETGSGRISQRIVRFDLRHPVIFYYSANTPSNYVDAVKDGILYWNTAFGTNIVEAKKAPEGVTAPDVDDNIIQWVPWDNAGFAYADILVDPLTGETERGQAYITSVFAFMGRADARVLLRSMEEAAKPKKGGKKGKKDALRNSLPFFNSQPLCEVDKTEFAAQMAHGLEEVLASDNLTDAAILRASQDYVREVVAHEVGHVFGLRHNFAGSLGATLTQKELDKWFKAYMAGNSLDAYTNKIPTTTVMDYNVLKSAMFIGWRMRTVKKALPHDIASIGWGYHDSSAARDQKLLFGTDEDVFRYGDVRRFDYGTNAVVSAYSDIAELINRLPSIIIERYIRAKAPRDPNDRVPLDQVNLSYTLYAMELAYQYDDMLSWFRSDTRSLRIENEFDFIGDLNRKDRLKANWKSLNEQVDELGGVDRALFSFLPVNLDLDTKKKPENVAAADQLDADKLTKHLEKLLNSSNYMTFVGLDDKKYSFTKDEKELITSRAKKMFEKLDPEVVHQVCLRLGEANRNLDADANGSVGDDDIVSKFENRVIDLAKKVVMAKKDDDRLSGKIDKAFVEVPEFKYDQPTRLAAVHMLRQDIGSFRGWADEARANLNEDLRKEMEASLNIDHFKDFKSTMLSRTLYQWYQQQEELLAQLQGAPPPVPPAKD
jgi:hypothetical protein